MLPATSAIMRRSGARENLFGLALKRARAFVFSPGMDSHGQIVQSVASASTVAGASHQWQGLFIKPAAFLLSPEIVMHLADIEVARASALRSLAACAAARARVVCSRAFF